LLPLEEVQALEGSPHSLMGCEAGSPMAAVAGAHNSPHGLVLVGLAQPVTGSVDP
jgi:hypothetical protein